MPATCPFLLFLMLAVVLPCSGQSLSVFDVDASAFPTVSAKFYAVDAQKEMIRGLGRADLRVTEGGVPCTVTSVTCPGGEKPGKLTVGLLVDTYSHIDLARAGSERLVDYLEMPRHELGIVAMDHGVFVARDITRDRTKALEAARTVPAAAGVDLQAMFYDPLAGGVPFVSGRPNRKILVLISDLHCPIFNLDEARLYADAVRENITVYAVLLHTKDYQGALTRVTGSTGGKVFENIESREQIVDIFSRIVLAEQNEACTMTWESVGGCSIGEQAVVSIPSRALTATVDYTRPAGALRRLQVVPEAIRLLDSSASAGTVDTVITITAQGGAVIIRDITVSNARFTILPPLPQLPFVLGRGESRQISIRYTGSKEDYAFGIVLFDTDDCNDVVSLITAGWPIGAPQESTLKLTHPNGAEEFLVGSDTVITWEGVLPDEPVKLEYSIDAGSNWILIDSAATGLRFPWSVPNTPSTRCLARVTQLGVGFSGRDTTITLDFDAVIDRVERIEFTRDGSRVIVCGGDSAYVVYDAMTGKRLASMSLMPHLTAGFLSVSPDGVHVATAGFNEDLVRIHNMVTGALVHTLSNNKRVETVQYDDAGARLAVAYSDGEVTLWNPTDGTEIRTIALGIGEVTALAFDRSGSLLAAAGGNSPIPKATIIDTRTYERLHTFNLDGQAHVVRFSNDGTLLATGGFEEIELWDVETGTRALKVPGIRNARSMEFMQDDRYIVVGSSLNHGIFIIDRRTGVIVQNLRSLGVSAVALHPMGLGYAYIDWSPYRSAHLRIFSGAREAQQDVSDDLWSIIAPQREFATLDIDMGNVVLGGDRDSIVVGTICNRGSMLLHILGMDVTSGDVDDFMIMSGAGEFILEPGECRDVTFTFMPMKLGPLEARVTVRSTIDTLRDTIRVRGVGVAPHLEVITRVVDFGKVTVGAQRDTIGVNVIRNIGTGNVVVERVRLIGPDMKQFAIPGGDVPFTLAPGESRAIDLRFAPLEGGRTSGRIAFEFDGLGSPAIVALYGEGIRPMLDAPGASMVSLCDSTFDTTIVVRNSGESKLTIASGSIAGTDAGRFSLSSPGFPIELWPGDEDTVAIRFTAAAPGDRTADLVLTSDAVNAIGGTSIIPLRGRRDVISFELTIPYVDFGSFAPSATGEATLLFRNTGTLPISWNAPIDMAPFTIESIEPTEVPPGEDAVMTVRFNGSLTYGEFIISHTFVDVRCNASATLTMRALVDSIGNPLTAVATLSTPEITASAGEIIEVPIRIGNVRNLVQSGANAFTTELRFNGSLLLPMAPTPMGRMEGRERVIDLSLPANIGPDSILARLRFRAALGDDSVTTLTLSRSAAVGGAVSITETPGAFRLTGICPDDDPRLFSSDGRTLLKPVRPNPVTGVSEIEYEIGEPGHIVLSLTDAQGTVIRTLVEGDALPGRYMVALDGGSLASGTYLITLTTPTRRLSTTIQVRN